MAVANREERFAPQMALGWSWGELGQALPAQELETELPLLSGLLPPRDFSLSQTSKSPKRWRERGFAPSDCITCSPAVEGETLALSEPSGCLHFPW